MPKKGWTTITVKESEYFKLYHQWQYVKTNYYAEQLYSFSQFVLDSAKKRLENA